jgi:uncharacterized membrane protein YkvA (DUF1232 family)
MPDNRQSSGSGFDALDLGDIVGRLRLAWRLLLDERVPVFVKAIPILAILYALWPIDLIPDLFPALGQLDDIAILLLALNWFIQASPSDVVEAIRQGEDEAVSARYTYVDRDERST